MEISIQSNVGQCGIRIAAKLNRAKLSAASEKLVGYLLWHDVASAIYSGGKKAQFKREDGYSPALGERADKEAKEILGKYFDDVQIETFVFEKASDETKFLAFCGKLGLDPAKAKSAWEQANQVQEEKPSEVIE